MKWNKKEFIENMKLGAMIIGSGLLVYAQNTCSRKNATESQESEPTQKTVVVPAQKDSVAANVHTMVLQNTKTR